MAEHQFPGVADRLARIVREYGRHAVTDPVALRSAWRATGTGEPPPELLAVAEHAEPLGTAPRRAAVLDDVVGPAAAGSGLPHDRMRRAAGMIVDVLSGDPPSTSEGSAPGAGGTSSTPDGTPDVGGPTLPPRTPDTPAGHRLVWEDAPPAPVTVTVPAVAPPRRRRTVLVAGALALVVAVGAGVAVAVSGPGGGSGTAAEQDRYAVPDVADRYRALGADVLAGATRCAPDRAAPGETERVRCDVDGYALVLRTFDGPQRMRDARAAAVPDGDVVRSARRTRDDGAVAISEERSGRSTVAWDAQVPRPVSAAVTAPASLVDLAAFLDSRRFALVPRPDVPGPAFRSGALWDLASAYVRYEPSVRCGAVQPEATEKETVQCTMAGGGRSQFSLLRDREAFRAARTAFADEGGKRPEGRSVTAWNRSGGPTVGLLSQYVQLDDGRPALYFDDDALGGYGVLFGPPGGSQADLLQFWSGVARPR